MNSPTTSGDPAGQVGSPVRNPRTEAPERISAGAVDGSTGRRPGAVPALLRGRDVVRIEEIRTPRRAVRPARRDAVDAGTLARTRRVVREAGRS
ncbi:hypothetical protein [Nocardia sp. BMG111209]|uniref:hypothetical protein n=1 Tax=Nocardia sp. BMG111209 TaxID=1160137 RepID=UPI00037723F7|nr:hypothetical protein [Nocardia sp. BMG111209]